MIGATVPSLPSLPVSLRRPFEAGFASTGDAVPGEAWERWFRRFFVLSALLAVVALVSASLDAGASVSRRAAGAALLPGLAWWFWFRMLRRPLIEIRGGQVALYIAIALPLFIVLINLHPSYRLLIFVAYWQVFAFLRLVPALLVAALLSLALDLTFGGWRGEVPLNSAADWVVFGLSLLFGGTMAAFIGSIMREGDKRRVLIEQLRAAQAELARSERAGGVAAERQRLAGEIHDTLAQDLASIVMHLEAAESRLDHDAGGVAFHLSAARQTARDGVNEARRMVHALRPEILAGGDLDEALRQVANRWSERAGVAAAFSVNGQPPDLDRTSEVVLLRGLQEALANIQKHAAATRVTITLSNLDDEVILDIRDNGRGFDLAAPRLAEDGHGVGLATMRERIAEAGGSLAVESAPGEGTALALMLPIAKGDADHA